ncbi:hypothetical protein PT2222_150266 [Paraburkholderia tropica]
MGRGSHARETLRIDDADLLAVRLDEPFPVEARKHPADGFEFHAEKTANFFTAHLQVELRARVAAHAKTGGKVEQEGREPLFRRHRAEQHHEARFAHDFAAHQLIEMMLHAAAFAAQRLQLAERDDADRAVFERDRVAIVRTGAHAVEAERFAGNLEARDLFMAVAMHDDRFERASAYRVEALEGIVGAKQRLAAPHDARREDEGIQLLELRGTEVGRHADRAQRAGRAARGRTAHSGLARRGLQRDHRPGRGRRHGKRGVANGLGIHESLQFIARGSRVVSQALQWHGRRRRIRTSCRRTRRRPPVRRRP